MAGPERRWSLRRPGFDGVLGLVAAALLVAVVVGVGAWAGRGAPTRVEASTGWAVPQPVGPVGGAAFAGLAAGAGLGLVARWGRRRLVRDLNAALVRIDRLEAEVRHDPLTGVLNRTGLWQELDREWSRAVREGRPMSLLMVDVDGFKSFNQRHGHLAGDEYLGDFAARLAGSLKRPGDVVGRYGGDEFLVVLPDTEYAGARAVAARVSRAVTMREPPPRSGPVEVVTATIGIASDCPRQGSSPLALVAVADWDLLQRKSWNGKSSRPDTPPASESLEVLFREPVGSGLRGSVQS